MEKLQLGVSLKAMGPNPFDDIDKYEIGKTYKIKIIKLADFGAFGDLQEGLTVLLHQSELSHKKMFRPKNVLCRTGNFSCNKRN